MGLTTSKTVKAAGKGYYFDVSKLYPGYHEKDVVDKTVAFNKGYTTKNSIVAKNKSWKIKITGVKGYRFSEDGEYDPNVGRQINVYGTFYNNSKHKLGSYENFFGDHFRVYQVTKNGKLFNLRLDANPTFTAKNDKVYETYTINPYIKAHRSVKFFEGVNYTQDIYKGQKIIVRAYDNVNKKHPKQLASKTFRLPKIIDENKSSTLDD